MPLQMIFIDLEKRLRGEKKSREAWTLERKTANWKREEQHEQKKQQKTIETWINESKVVRKKKVKRKCAKKV